MPPLSEADAKKALLTLDDLSEGWKVDPDDDADADVKVTEGSAACKKFMEGPDDEAPTKVGTSFSQGEDAFLSSGVESYESSQAKKEWDADVKALTACDHFTLGDSDGFRIELEVKPVPIAELGDDTVAFHATGTVENVTLHLDLLGVRAGRNTAGITAMTFGDPAPRDKLEAMLETVVDRLDKLEDAA